MSAKPLHRVFSARYDFPSEWNRFLHPSSGGPAELAFDLTGRLPLELNSLQPEVVQLLFFVRFTQSIPDDIHMFAAELVASGVAANLLDPSSDGSRGFVRSDVGTRIYQASATLASAPRQAGAFAIRIDPAVVPEPPADLFVMCRYRLLART